MKVHIDGSYTFTRVRNNEDLGRYRVGLTLADLKGCRFKTDQLWIVAEDLRISVEDARETVHYLFRPGYVTDMATVPKFFRGVLDNDDLRVIAAALVHDYNFATAHESFKVSNTLMFRMMRAVGASWFKSVVAWLAISSPVGRWRYNEGRGDFIQVANSFCHVDREPKKWR